MRIGKSYVFSDDKKLVIRGKNCDSLTVKSVLDSGAEAVFTGERWASLVLCFDEIDRQLEWAGNGRWSVDYRRHLGGGWYVSLYGIGDGRVPDVDLRKHRQVRLRSGPAVWPTRHGIRLRRTEWPLFKSAVQTARCEHLMVACFTPCSLNRDHSTPELERACTECNPFLEVTGL